MSKLPHHPPDEEHEWGAFGMTASDHNMLSFVR